MRTALTRRENVSAVLRALIRRGPLPRVEIADLIGLSSASATRLTADLIAAGVVRQLDGSPGGRQGAPRVPIDVRAEGFVALGIQLGQRRASVGLVDLRGNVLDRAEFRYKSTQPRSVMAGVARSAEALLDRSAEGARFIGTGVAIGGHVDPGVGVAVKNTGLGWVDVPLRDLAQGSLPGPIFVQNTWQGLAQTELLLARTCESREFVLLFIGNLIGAATVIDGKIHAGAHFAGGDVAHLAVTQRGPRCAECGQRNCFLAVAGDQAVLHRVADEGLLPPDATEEQLGEFLATATAATQRRLLRPRARAIGEVVASLVDILDPEMVVLADLMYELPGYQKDFSDGVGRRRSSGLQPTRLMHVAPDAILPGAVQVLEAFYADPLVSASA